MESLKDKLNDLISGAIPQTHENLKFCGNEGKYAEKGFYEMIENVMDTIATHITEALSDEIK